MSEPDQYERVCRAQFEEIKTLLYKMDECLRGNGKVGMTTRLDRVETQTATLSKLMWLVGGSAITAVVSVVVNIVVR